MLKRLIVALALMGFLGAVTLPSYTTAQTTTTDETKDAKKKKAAKKKDETKAADTKEEPKKKAEKAEKKDKKAPSAKQLAARKKFSDCAKTWGNHKKETGEKTRKQYNAYMSKCLKKDG